MLGVELGNAGAECNLAFPLCLRWDLCVSEGGFLICGFGCVSEERETSVKILRNVSALRDDVPLARSVKQLQQPETKAVGKCFSSTDLLLTVQPSTKCSVMFCSV